MARLRAAPATLLVAPGGYGKSTLAAQLANHLDVALVRAELRDATDAPALIDVLAAAWRRSGFGLIADALSADDPAGSIERLGERVAAANVACLLLVDEAQRADAQAGELLDALLHQATLRMRVVIAGRRLPPTLSQATERADVELLGGHDLRLTSDEVAAMAEQATGGRVDAALVASIARATEGWPAATALAVAALAGGGATQLPPPGPGLMSGLVDDLLATSGAGARAVAERAATLPLLSERVAEIVGGPGALGLLLDAGLPLRQRPDGWWELPDRIRESLASGMPATDALRAVATEYARSGELADALRLTSASADHATTLELIAAQPRERLQATGLHYLDALLQAIPDAELAARPAALVRLIRAAEHDHRLRDAWLARAGPLVAADAAAARAISAERSLAMARQGALDDARGVADDVLRAAAATEVLTRGRAYLARGLCLLLQDTRGASERVAADFQAAIGLFEVAGDHGWQADAHQALGYGCHYTAGALEAAAERLERALALRPAPDAARAQTLTFVAEVLSHLGRYDDASVALQEARLIGRRLGDHRSIGYAAWSAAQLARMQRDRGAALAALEEAEHHPEGWFDTLAGIDFLANAVDIRLAVGDVEGARHDLERAERRASGTPRAAAPLGARARFEALHGDPAAALRHLDALDQSPLAYRGDRWLHQLLRAVAAARAGDAARARSLLASAQQAVAGEGDPERLARLEPQLVAAVEMRPESTNDSAASVRLLGQFAVERGGQNVSPPPGRPSALVKLLALRGTVTPDEAIDELWPDADADTGRARLRNLLNRIRTASGELVERRDGALALAPGTLVDAHRFEEEAAAALVASAAERAALARRALVRFTGELLPADRYAEWAALPRERIRRRQLALLDVVADDALERGDLDEAARLLDQAIADDPLEEIRYVRLARALAAQGRTRRASQVAEAGRAVAVDLGVEPGDELRTLLDELGVRAVAPP